MSLRDQLLKAGLVSSEKAKAAENQSRKQQHQSKKGQTPNAEEQARQQAQAQEAQRKREQDRERNRQREAERVRKEKLNQARQFISANRVAVSPESQEYYNFQDGRYIRRIRVSAQQKKQLAMGLLGVARNDRDPFDYPLLQRSDALKLQELIPEWMLLLYDENDGQDDGDEWPADWT